MEGFSPAFLYSLSPDGRFLLRRDRRSFGLEMYPVGTGGEVGKPVDLAQHRTRFTLWARDGSRLYGLRYRERTPLVLAIDPARPRAKAREIPLAGISGRVIGAFRHPGRADRLVLRTFGREGEGRWLCGIENPGCERVFAAAGGGWRSILGRDGRPAARHRFRDGRRELEARIDGTWKAAGEMSADRTLITALAARCGRLGAGALQPHPRHHRPGALELARTLEERPVFFTPESDLQQALLSVSDEPLAAASFSATRGPPPCIRPSTGCSSSSGPGIRLRPS